MKHIKKFAKLVILENGKKKYYVTILLIVSFMKYAMKS